MVSAVNGCLPVVWKTPDVTDPSLYEYTGIVKSHKEDPYEKAFTGHLPYGGDDVCLAAGCSGTGESEDEEVRKASAGTSELRLTSRRNLPKSP